MFTTVTSHIQPVTWSTARYYIECVMTIMELAVSYPTYNNVDYTFVFVLRDTLHIICAFVYN